MDKLTGWIALPLGYLMEWCYRFLGDYGIAIIIFTLLTKFVILPLSVWVQKNSIKMIQMQPEINRIKARFFGDGDMIADEESKLYKRYHYNPLANIIPLLIQIVLLMGVVGVIYHPFDYLFHISGELTQALCGIAADLTGIPLSDSSIQLAAVECIQNPDLFPEFLGLESRFQGLSETLAQIQSFDLLFLGISLSDNPSKVLGITVLVPLAAGLSSYLLCVAQNRSNVLQAEQSKASQWSMLALSVGLSLYLGFFVPAGIALYWIASNLLAIVQLYALNAAIPPKAYIDYKALEESRQELASLNALGTKKKLFANDENARREKADYKRFFSIANKHLVFYSEKSGFYRYYKELIEYLLKKTTVTIHYVTNDPDDIVFELAKTQPRLKPYYIGVKKMITLMMKIEADIVVMTTPDLDNYYIKRSLLKKDIEYVYVPHDPASMHLGFREHALDHFDTVFCTGPHIAREVRASEKLYGTKEKNLVEFGYPLMEQLMHSCEALPSNAADRRKILIAPSWQEDNLLDSCIDDLIESLYGDDFEIIVRPHPEYMKRFSPKMQLIMDRYAHLIGDGLRFQLDFSDSSSVYSSDLLVTDWSGIGIEFGFATLKPVVFVNTKIKKENPNYEKLGIEAQEIKLRNILGTALEKDALKQTFAPTVRKLLDDPEFAGKIRVLREEYFYHLGSEGSFGGKYLVDRLLHRK